jgi:small subunit ribosomal protein S1
MRTSLGELSTATLWDKVAERYPPGSVITGKVCNLTNYGAFIEIEEGIDGLLHVGDMSWVRKVGHPSEVVHKGDQATCVILTVDPERRRMEAGSLSWLRPHPNPPPSCCSPSARSVSSDGRAVT